MKADYKQWTAATLRQPFLSYPVGKICFVREVSTKTPLSVGTVFWVKPQHEETFHSVAESYGGRYLFNLFSPMRNVKGELLIAGDLVSSHLNSAFKAWITNAPAGARRFPYKQQPTTLKSQPKAV
jgi:hypothetical protein